MTLSLTADSLETAGPVPDQVRALLARARAQTATAMTELRRLIDGIGPAALDAGLSDALTRLGALSPVPVALHVDLRDRPDAWIERIAYFSVAELLTNVGKHSSATEASVDVRTAGGRLHLRVRDDGTGGARPGRGTGLTGLQERIRAVDGRLELDSPVGGPTTARVELPIHL